MVYGAPGNDTTVGSGARMNFRLSTRGMRVDLATGIARGMGRDRLVRVFQVDGSAFADVLVGSSRGDTFSGRGGNDIVRSGAGADSVRPGVGADVVDAGDGGDSGSFRNDVVHLGGGDDQARMRGGKVYGDEGDDVLQPYGATTIDGGAGADLLVLRPLAPRDRVAADLNVGGADIGELVLFTSIERLLGSDGDDAFVGDDHANIIDSGAGDDTIDGRAGDDQLWGGEGNDTVVGGEGDDALYGQGGADVLVGEAGLDTIDGGSGTDDLCLGETLVDCP